MSKISQINIYYISERLRKELSKAKMKSFTEFFFLLKVLSFPSIIFISGSRFSKTRAFIKLDLETNAPRDTRDFHGASSTPRSFSPSPSLPRCCFAASYNIPRSPRELLAHATSLSSSAARRSNVPSRFLSRSARGNAADGYKRDCLRRNESQSVAACVALDSVIL